MKMAKLLLAVMAAVLLWSPQAMAAEDAPVLAVEGRGSASVAPDQAVLTVGVMSTGSSASQAQAVKAPKIMTITQ